MKRSNNASNYILIKASVQSEWDSCDFSIIYIDDNWRTNMKKRLTAIKAFKNDYSFSSLSYYDTPQGYYTNSTDSNNSPNGTDLLEDEETWCFIELEENELDTLSTPENSLDGHELIMDKYGKAYFKANGKYSNEEFSTDIFTVKELINKK